MRGEVLYFDTQRGTGFISGEDGNRYAFDLAAVDGGGAPSKGTRVEFAADGGHARSIVLIDRPVTATTIAQGERVARPFRLPDVSQPSANAAAGDMGVFGYFRHVLFDNYANFRGRARRKEYWSFILVWLMVIVAVSLATVAIDASLGNLEEGDTPFVTVAVTGLLSLAVMIPALAVTVRRQHDIGLSGWFILVGFIPSVGNLIILVFTLIPSQKHDNKWGPVPEGVR